MDPARSLPVRRAVVLAAGVGRRLRGAADGLPKPLVPVGGRPLILPTLEALAAAGFPEAFVVVGHRAELVEGTLARAAPLPLRFGQNPLYWEPAGRSLAAARAYCGEEPFLLAVADHLLSAELVAALCEGAAGAPPDAAVVAADFHPRPARYTAEATKLQVAPTPPGTRLPPVTAIGKELSPADALDAGAFVCPPAVWSLLEALGPACELSALFGAMAREGRLFAADVSGSFWYDVDTAEDLRAAEALLADLTSLAARPAVHP